MEERNLEECIIRRQMLVPAEMRDIAARIDRIIENDDETNETKNARIIHAVLWGVANLNLDDLVRDTERWREVRRAMGLS